MDALTGDGFLAAFALLALAAFWASALTTLGDVYQQVRILRSRRRGWGPVRRGRVISGDGPGGALAVHRFEQIGHALDARRATVELTERAHDSRVFGGTVEIDGEPTPVRAGALPVWFDDGSFARSGEIDDGALAALHEAATNEKGVVREVELSLHEGDPVFVTGDRVELLSTFDPRAWTSRKLALLGLFAAGHLIVAVALTWMCLSAPFDSLVVKLAAAGCLSHFLLAPPILKAVRESVQAPDEARRHWRVVSP